MKIYIMTDLEGATGVYSFRQTRERGTPAYHEAVHLLMGDIAAVAEGLKAAGATDILALDGHGGGGNFLPECMVPGVRHITGSGCCRPVWGLDETCDGLVLLGYHAMNGTPDGVLHHTQCSKTEAKYWYDGVERGEIFQHAALGGHFNVPVLLVTGDEAACREARATLGDDLPVVAVKRGINREAAALLAAAETRPLLVEGARQALAARAARKPLKPAFPLALRIRESDPQRAVPETPWFAERTCVVRTGLDIFTGSPG